MFVTTLLCLTTLASFPILAAEVHRHALVIGINRGGLEYAAHDAQGFAGLIESPRGGNFPVENVRLLLNEQATREGILVGGIEWIGKRVRDDQALGFETLVYIFLATHGIVRPGTNQAYFMPWGSNFDSPQGLGIRADEFIAEIRAEIPASRVIYFLDACHSAASVMGGGQIRGDSVNIYNSLDLLFKTDLRNQDVTRMGFLSAQPHELSYEDPKLAHGVFTYFVLRGLGDLEADRRPTGNEDGKVTADELIRYLELKVPAYVKSMFRELADPPTQTPQVSPGYKPDAPLAGGIVPILRPAEHH